MHGLEVIVTRNVQASARELVRSVQATIEPALWDLWLRTVTEELRNGR
jgi:hypothetical protein